MIATFYLIIVFSNSGYNFSSQAAVSVPQPSSQACEAAAKKIEREEDASAFCVRGTGK